MLETSLADMAVADAVEHWLRSCVHGLGHTIGDIDMFLLEEHDQPPEEGCYSRLFKLRYYADRVAEPAGVIVSELPVKVRYVVDDAN